MEVVNRGKWRYVLVLCEVCGVKKETRIDCYKEGRSKKCKSCALKSRPKSVYTSPATHGKSRTLTWNSWYSMRRRIRCGSKHHPTYQDLDIDPRWQDFSVFLSDMGERPSKEYSIDRIDNTKGYWPQNCRWATKRQQATNRSSNLMLTYKGKSQCLSAWAKDIGVHRDTLKKRLGEGLTIEDLVDSDIKW